MEMHFNRARQYFRSEHHAQMGRLGQIAHEYNRLVYGPSDPYGYSLGGIQHVGLWLDCRARESKLSTLILVDAGCKNRYRYMMNGIKQDGLLGKYEAAIELQKRVI